MCAVVRNLCHVFVLTFLLNGGFHQSMLLLSVFAFGVCRWIVLGSVMVYPFVGGFLV